MKVIVDDKIPFIKGEIEKYADQVVYCKGASFTPELVHDADALIIRTRTLCNKDLLEGSRVKFIATATIGFDHIDLDYLKEAGISWQNCPGCNASSVKQYVRSCLLLLQREKGYSLKHRTIGIVGAGHVGSLIIELAEEMGWDILLNDPPLLNDKGAGCKSHPFVSLQQLAEQSDIVTFHTPMVKEGPHSTYHLANHIFFKHLKKGAVLFNTCRGGVIDECALKEAMEDGTISNAIIDTWEHEPNIDLDLLHKVFIGTPHIAGYSADGKANATRMALTAFCQHFHIESQLHIYPPQLPEGTVTAIDADERALQLYNPHRDADALLRHPELFEDLRGNYPLRREKTEV